LYAPVSRQPRGGAYSCAVFRHSNDTLIVATQSRR
jgi:hypothetical protein